MAVTKLWSVTHSLKHVIDYANDPEKTSIKNFSEEQYQALADVLTYAKDEEKTEKVFYAQGVNCNVTYARDEFVYVKDLCQMMYKALFANVNGGTYNVGTGIRTSLKEQIQGMIEVFSPKEKRSNIIEIPGEASFTSFVMDIDNAEQDLGYKPEFTYLKYLEDYKKEQELKRFDELWKR